MARKTETRRAAHDAVGAEEVRSRRLLYQTREIQLAVRPHADRWAVDIRIYWPPTCLQLYYGEAQAKLRIDQGRVRVTEGGERRPSTA